MSDIVPKNEHGRRITASVTGWTSIPNEKIICSCIEFNIRSFSNVCKSWERSRNLENGYQTNWKLQIYSGEKPWGKSFFGDSKERVFSIGLSLESKSGSTVIIQNASTLGLGGSHPLSCQSEMFMDTRNGCVLFGGQNGVVHHELMDNKWSVKSKHWTKNEMNGTIDMAKSSYTLTNRMSINLSRKRWMHWTGMSYPTRRTCQT